MLKFAKKEISGNRTIYALDVDDREAGLVTTEGGVILSATYGSPEIDLKYGDFMLRSAVFVLRDKFDKVETRFVDDRLRPLGFTEQDGKMTADSLKIRFDNCCCDRKGE